MAAYTDIYLQQGVYERLRDNAKAMAAVKSALLALPGHRERVPSRRRQLARGARVERPADQGSRAQLLRRSQRRSDS